MDNQIQEEVDRLREQCSNTRDLYREVCALLFFRYGITPTTNKLYQLVRKGSMSVPTEVLRNFWKELREKSEIKLKHPGVPDDLSHLAGDLIAKIWDKAQLAAHESLNALRSEVEVKVERLQLERDELDSQRTEAVLKLQDAEESLAKKIHESTQLKQLLAEYETHKRSLEKQLSEAASQLDIQRQTMKLEVEKLKTTMANMQEQVRQESFQVKRDMNRQQAYSDKLEKALSACRTANQRLQDQQQIECNSLRAQIADLRERLGEQNGKLELTQTINAQLQAEIAVKEEKLKEILGKVADSKRQYKNWSDRIRRKKKKSFRSSKNS